MAQRWYAIHTQTGQEENVKKNLESRCTLEHLEETFKEIVIPSEKISEVRAGKKKISNRKFFPGYILIRMQMTDEAWYMVKGTPGVTGFIGSGRKPLPLDDKEVDTIIKASEEKHEKATPKTIFEKGESVRVKEGPFVNFNGTIEEVNPNKGKLRVMVPIFGRTTPVELEYWQVEKL